MLSEHDLVYDSIAGPNRQTRPTRLTRQTQSAALVFATMMTPEAHVNAPARVSILERLIPSLAFAVAATSGAIGALMIVRFLHAMSLAETAGYAAFYGGVAEIEFTIGIVLIIAAVLCGIGIVVSIIRLFTTNTTSSPPGLLFLVIGVLSLIPPFAIHYILRSMKTVLESPTPTEGGISAIGETVTYLSYAAIVSALAVVVITLAFAFIPFSSRSGRKVLPLVSLILIELLIAFLIGFSFWSARASFIERDKDRVEQFSEPQESPIDDDAPVEIPNVVGDMLEGIEGEQQTSNSNSKSISGGVLNGKAIELPQPPFPPAARAVRASGAVSVQVMVDEKGNVSSASAVSGHPLLRAAAVQAARNAKFKPTMLSGKPVKVTGVLTYNFSL